MSVAPPNWYPDPQHPSQLRYWDGGQWTAHVAPGAPPQAPAAQPPSRQGMSGGAIAGIVVGITVGVVIVVGILAAIAIPVFLNQREKAAAIEAQNAARELATAITTVQIDSPGEIPTASQLGSAVVVTGVSGGEQFVTLPNSVNYGGFAARDAENWCVYVTTSGSEITSYQYSTWGGIEPGNCSVLP